MDLSAHCAPGLLGGAQPVGTSHSMTAYECYREFLITELHSVLYDNVVNISKHTQITVSFLHSKKIAQVAIDSTFVSLPTGFTSSQYF